MWYDANYGEGAQYYKSDEPITVLDAVYGKVSQTGNLETGLMLEAECRDSRYPAGSGMAFDTGLKVGDLDKIAILADFSTHGTGVFNLFFDLNHDGKYFEFDGDKYIGPGADNYALCQPYPSDGSKTFVLDGSTEFHIMKSGGVHSLAEIASGEAGIPKDTPVAFWVGVWDTTAGDGPLSLTLRDVRVNPTDIVIDDDLSAKSVGEVVEYDGASYVYGFDAFSSIQSAIDAAPNGAVAQVMAGIYDEEVEIDKSITLEGEGTDSTIIAPSAPVNAIVTVLGQDVKAKITGFTVKGPCTVKGPESFLAGILVKHGAYCEITGNKILDIRESEDLIGMQRGVGVFVGRQSWNTSGRAAIVNNIITGYQKGGIVVDNVGSEAGIVGNTITGRGQTSVTAQNGIQISRGAKATVTGNTIESNWYTGDPQWSATGILLYEAGDTTVTGNTLNANQVAIDTDSRASFPGVLENVFGSEEMANGLNVSVYVEGWPAPDEIWVDADYEDYEEGTIVDRAIRGYDAFANISDGISAVAPGGTVHVAAGMYEDSITISKALTLLGPNAGTDPNESARNDEAGFKGTFSLDTADGADVVIDGLMFFDDQIGRDHISVYLKGCGDYEIKNCVFKRDTDETDEALDSEKGRMIRAIHIGPASCSAVIENNLFTGSDTDIYRNSSWRSAIWSDGVISEEGVVIRNNVFHTNRTALNLDNRVNNITISGNRFVNNGTHISFGGNPALTGQYTVSGNEFSLAGAVFNLSGVDPGFRLDATDNEYDVSALDSVVNATTPASMDLEDLFILESAMYHKGRDGRQGLVRVVDDTLFVTPTSGTIQQAIDAADPGDVVEIAAGEYNQTFTVAKGVTVRGRGIGATIIKPSALLQTGVGHKYDDNMAVTVFVNGAGGDGHEVSIQELTIDGNGENLNGNSVVFWNDSVGSLERVEVRNPRPFSGAQTGHAVAVDAGQGKSTVLNVKDCLISTFNKNGIDAVNGNGKTTDGGNITVNVMGGSVTGRGATDTTAQNGVLFWERAGGTVGGSVQGTEISGFAYTKSETYAGGILVYGALNGKVEIEDVSFHGTDQYVCLAEGTDENIDLVNCTFDGRSADSASDADLASIEDKIWHGMDEEGIGLVTFRRDTLVVTKDTRGIQAAIDAASSGEEVIIAAGTYKENLVIDGKNVKLRSMEGAEKTAIEPAAEETNTIELRGNTTGVQIGTEGHGFTITGAVANNPGIETSAIYLQGPHSNTRIEGNHIVANGDCAILTEWGAAVSDFVISGNVISGKSFLGDHPAGQGTSEQFTLPNVPRPLVYIGGTNKADITFTHNQVTGVTGGLNEEGKPQGNTVVNIDAARAVIADNTFSGDTAWAGASLRARGTNTVIEDNVFSSGPLLNVHVLLGEGTVEGGTDAVTASNTFNRGAHVVGGYAVFSNIQSAVDAASSEDTIMVAAGTYRENVVIRGDKDGLSLVGAGSDKTTITPASGRAVTLQGYPEGRPITGVKVEGFTLKSVDSVPFIALSSTPDDKPYTKDLVLSDVVVDGGQWGIVLNGVEGATLGDVRLRNITGTSGALELTGVSGLKFTHGTLEGNAIAVRLQSTSSGPGAGYGPNGDIEIYESRIVNNGVAIENRDTGTTIDATNNYWGQPAGPDDGKIAGNAATAPWYMDEAMSILSNKMTLKVSHTGNGHVKVKPDKAEYSYGDPVTLIAVPDKSWKFSRWSGDVTGSLPEVTVIIDGNKTVAASFAELGRSTYGFTVTVPSEVVEDREYTGEVTLKATTVDEAGYDLVRVNVKVVKPDGATVNLKARDSNGVEHDVAAIGYWGPEGGFPIGADYSTTTPVKATFSRPGVYTITLSLVDMSSNRELAHETLTLTVKAHAVTPPSGGEGGGSGTLPPVIAPSVTETVEAATGGTVELEDGSAAVVLPAGATTEDVTVTISPVTEVTQPTTGMVMIGGRIYEITAETDAGELITEFLQPITLTFTFTEDELAEAEAKVEDLRVFYWDEDAGSWIALPTAVDPVAGTVTAATTHFTVFALMAKPDMPSLKDVRGHWAESCVLRLVSLGVVGGYEDGSYRPEAGITRQEFAKMVVLAAGLEPDSGPVLTFADGDQMAGWARGTCLRP